MPVPPTLHRVKVMEVATDVYSGRPGRIVSVVWTAPGDMPAAGSWVTLAPDAEDLFAWMRGQSKAREAVVKAAEEWYDKMHGMYTATGPDWLDNTWVGELFRAVAKMRDEDVF